MLSNLSPKLKKELDEQRNISMDLGKYLQLQEQVSPLITIYWQKKQAQLPLQNVRYLKTEPGFNVDNFSRKHGLLKFAFVRHPFDRYAPMV